MIQASQALQALPGSRFDDYTSVCQLQLGRLVQQFSAVAGCLIYHHSFLKQRQYLKAIQPASESLVLQNLDEIESEVFLHRLDCKATEVEPDLWEFNCTPSAHSKNLLYGLKFRETLSQQWAYLMFWSNRARRVARARQLQIEIEILKNCILLDQQYSYCRTQTKQYQQILQRIEHQLRNPLATIHLYASNLLSSLSHEQDQLQAVAIRDAVSYLSDHLTEMIAGCQRTQVKAERCQVRAIFTEAWQGLQLLAQAQQVELEMPTRSLEIMGDRTQLMQVFENLLHNALCFSPRHGKITVQWHEFCQEAVITIADQGPGLTPTDLQHMFRPYYTNRDQGSGLGLFIVRQIVEEHGGKIWADNSVPSGALFSIVLPRQQIPTASDFTHLF